jgi:Uma2 family endonuclease
MSTAQKLRYTPHEYLELERKSSTRNEYYRGKIFAMSGANRAHNLINGNLSAEIENQILDRNCECYGSDMRVWIEATGLYEDAPIAVEMRGGSPV